MRELHALPYTFDTLDRQWEGGITMGVQVELSAGVQAGDLILIREAAEEKPHAPTGRTLVRQVHRVDEGLREGKVHVILIVVPSRTRKR